MQKTKLGISVGLLGALIYFGGLFSGYFVAFVLAGYVLLAEDNEWLKKAAVKAVMVMICFSFASTVLGLIPDVFGWVDTLLGVFGGFFSYSLISSIVSVFTGALSLIRTVVLLLLGVKALNQGTISVPVVDTLVDKYMG